MKVLRSALQTFLSALCLVAHAACSRPAALQPQALERPLWLSASHAGKNAQGRHIQRASDQIFEQPERWPLAEPSQRYPFTVRYMKAADTPMARQVKAQLEQAWQLQVEQMGFRPPLPFDPGGQGRLSVFLLRGADTAVTGVRPARQADTWWDAYEAYISVDPWGPYGGAILAPTLAHEFNHTLQAAYDWFEAPGFFEASSTYIQDKAYPADNDYLEEVAEFQQRPDWSIDRDDDYASWFMYGACLYLFFLEQRYFSSEPRFLSQLWEGSRNRPRPLDPATGSPASASNDPDWVDALEALLPPDKTYADTVVEFARWRFYTGRYADGKHFHDARWQTAKGGVRLSATLDAARPDHTSPGPMVLGSEYIRIERPAGAKQVRFTLQGSPDTTWKIQAMPGLTPESDGETLQPGEPLRFGSHSHRVLAVTAVPRSAYDPDTRSDARYPFTLSLK